jgi:COP9 signalosome complex subunit 2
MADDDNSFDYNPDDFDSGGGDDDKKSGDDFGDDNFGDDNDFGNVDDFGANEDGSENMKSGGNASEEEDPEIILENQYLEAKDMMDEKKNTEDSLHEFEKVLNKEFENTGKRGKWGFKSLKWIIKINHTLMRNNDVMTKFVMLLDNYASMLVENERAMNKLFDHVAESPIIKELFKITLQKLEDSGNKKASLRLELRLAKVLLKRQDFSELDLLLESMHERCKVDGEDDSTKGNQLIEIYAMKIERYLRDLNPNFKILKTLYNKAVSIKALCNPRFLGVIHECGGKIFLRERNYKDANTDFIEAFKGYDSAGARDFAIQCLRYLILSNMLSNSPVNPFDDNRAKSYQSSNEIEAMLNLIESYRNRQITNFERVLKKNAKDLMGDPFISDYIQDLRKKLRSHVLKALIRPYKNITLPYITTELQVKSNEAESLLVELILDKEILGRIDQINQLLLLSSDSSSNTATYSGLSLWIKNLNSLEKSIIGRVN